VREEISTSGRQARRARRKQSDAIGLSRHDGGRGVAPPRRIDSEKTLPARSAYQSGQIRRPVSRKRSRALLRALRHEGRAAARAPLARHARGGLREAHPSAPAARKAARAKGRRRTLSSRAQGGANSRAKQGRRRLAWRNATSAE
jgi:hypothetical protein